MIPACSDACNGDLCSPKPYAPSPNTSSSLSSLPAFCFFHDTAPPEIYTLSLHDALPILPDVAGKISEPLSKTEKMVIINSGNGDRKSTRLNSSHVSSSYAVCCLKKK